MESTPPPENNPPEQLPTDSKRKTTNDDITGDTSNRHQTDRATNANMRLLRTNKDLDLLVNMQDYHSKKGSYPFPDIVKQREFYKKWMEGNVGYQNFIKMNRKMEELNEKFWSNSYRKSSGEDVEAFMDDVDKEIFRLSYEIWGKKENAHQNVNAANDLGADDNDGGLNANEG